MIIAAYGTLQERFGKWDQLGMTGNCKVIGRAKLQGKLYQQRWFPMLVESYDPRDLVDAELIEVTSNVGKVISNIDYFEGHPHFFKRKQFLVKGKNVSAYVWPHAIDPSFKRIFSFELDDFYAA
jgi:gamma-glutamylcyclotransferase (GGCT)/AIG2-like uncharacterized protein YtfP